MKILRPPERDELGSNAEGPPGPPHSGWVQQIAAGNAGWAVQFRFAVHVIWSRVPELWTLAVMKAAVIIVSLLLLCQGCHTHSQCRRELYQVYYAASTDAIFTLKLADDPRKIRTHGIMSLEASLSELQRLSKTADKDDLDRQPVLVRVILKYAEAHQDELCQDSYSLRMLAALKGITTKPEDIKRVSTLADYVSANSTNQEPVWKH